MGDNIPPITIPILRICSTKINRCKTHFLLIFHLFQNLGMVSGLIWIIMLFLAWDQHHHPMVGSVRFSRIIRPRFRNTSKRQIHQRKMTCKIKSLNFKINLFKIYHRKLSHRHQIQFWPEISSKMDWDRQYYNKTTTMRPSTIKKPNY